MRLGQTLKDIRKEYKLTQEGFAELFNVTRQTVSNWENEKSYPDLLTLIAISDKFNISLDKMLKEDIKMTKKLNKDIKWAKKSKLAIGVIIAVIAFLMCSWYFIWNFNKSLSEDKFQKGLSKYDYSIDESVKKGGYYIISYNENTYFALPNQSMPGFFDFATDFHAKDMECYIEQEGNTVTLCWTFYDGQENASEYISINREGSISDKLSESDKKEYADIIKFGTDIYNSVYR